MNDHRSSYNAFFFSFSLFYHPVPGDIEPMAASVQEVSAMNRATPILYIAVYYEWLAICLAIATTTYLDGMYGRVVVLWLSCLSFAE